MKIAVNGESREFNGKLLSELISELDLGDGGFAVAVGNDIIPRVKHNEFIVKENDDITIITATHGG